MIGVVNRVSIFFAAHPKRQGKFEKAIKHNQPGLTVNKLKDLCRTRWVERIENRCLRAIQDAVFIFSFLF